jgi:hypothetical protein
MIVNDWEKEEQLQKTFESVIQQIQTAESTIKAVIGNQLPMEESSKPPKTETNFANNGTIIEKQDML